MNVLKKMQAVVDSYSHLSKENIVVYPIGRKAYDKAQKLNVTCAGDFSQLIDKGSAQDCQHLSQSIASKFIDGEFDKVELIYHHFESAGSQVLTQRTFLPIDLATEVNRQEERDLKSVLATAESQEYLKQHRVERNSGSKNEKVLYHDNFIVEPSVSTVLETLIPKQLNLMFYTALLDSVASEHAARMVAMQTATDNADELLRGLSLQYNKSRQQAITNELLDIVGGSINN